MRKLGAMMIPTLSKGSPALSFDGTQNYIDLGLMTGFGAALGGGAYASFDIQTTTTDIGSPTVFGTLKTGNLNAFKYVLHSGVLNRGLVSLYDSLSKKIDKRFDSTIAINDGAIHRITITVTPATNVVVVTVDGVSQTMTNLNSQTPDTFIDFDKKMFVGANNNNGLVSNNAAIKLRNFKLGISAGTLYGNYAMGEGKGLTIADTSGQSNTGTLTGTPVPTWSTM